MKAKGRRFEAIMNCLCLLILVGTSVFLALIWRNVPETVPMHYNFAGEIDRWGGKSEMLILPVVMWFFYALLTGVERIPKAWNLDLIQVTEENRERVYSTTRRCIVSLKFVIVCWFSYMTLQTALNPRLPSWVLTAFLLVLFGDLGYWIWRTVKVSKKGGNRK